MAGNPPSGTVTFLLTDLEGSTRMWEQDPDAMKVAMVRHDELLEAAVAEHNGYVFSRMGDGMAAAFATARDALTAAVDFQQALADETWRTARALRARVGLHTDEAVIVDDTGYASLPINRCARLMTAAHGGQTVVSGSTEILMRGQLPDDMDLVDLGEHRLRDLGQPIRIFQVIRNGERHEFPPLRTLDSFPGNLPAQVSSFIGREIDVARVARALDGSRVVSVTGVGGVGKTRLALQVAAELLPRYRDGAWLVELAPVRDPDDVARAVAAVFRVTNASGQFSEDSLIDMLAHKRMLFVMDNCEHVLGPVARLVSRIERECPGVAVLATSREGMAIDGEQLVALPPLAVGELVEDVERLLQADAINLFVERARQVKADFALSSTNARAVVEICRRLDGVPLAIELAAARVIAMSPAELVERLDRRFHVLAGARRGAVERHATLRAAIDWSFALLGHDEQRLLARMSAFSGGCTLEAIEEVCSGDFVERDEIMGLVAGLVARSLVIAEDGDQGTRYRLLETIRQYCEERLAEQLETDAMLTRHAAFYTALSRRATESTYGPDQLAWARRVKVERDNIVSALTYAMDSGNAGLAVDIVASHPHQVRAEGPTGEVLLLPAVRVIEMPGAADEPNYPLVLLDAAYTVQATGDWEAVARLCDQALAAETRLGVTRHGQRIAMDIHGLQAQTALSRGAYVDAVTGYSKAAELARADGIVGLAAIFTSYRVNCVMLGSVPSDDIVATAEEAVALARRSRMPGATVLALNSLALALVDRDPRRARAALRESIELGNRPGQEIASGLLTAALVAGRLRDWPLSLALAGETLYLWRWSSALMQSAPCLALCGRALVEDRPEVAGVLRGAAYSGFHLGASRSQSSPAPGASDSDANFILAALRETGDLVAAALGEERRQQLRTEGAMMNMDEAVVYALSNIDPKLLSNPLTTIDP